MIKVGDVMKLSNPRGDDFIVKVLNTFEDEGVKYAEVESVDFNSFTREVKVDQLEEM